VPVGQDQKQHIEVARDIAQYFNSSYGEVLKLPEPYIPEHVAVVPGRDGRKMSKSYNNTIELFAPEEEVRRQIYSIVTDSATVAEPKDPDTSVIYSILRLFCTGEESEAWADRFRRGGMGYREVKQAIFEKFMERFGVARQRRQELESQPDRIAEALRQGVQKARAIGAPLVSRIRDAAGIADAACFSR